MINQPPTNLTLLIFGLLTVVVTTVVPLWIASRRKTADHKESLEAKKEDWARQDAVAARLIESNKVVAQAAGEMNDKLDVIHTLVNSKMTEEMQGRLEETQRSLAGLEEIVSLKQAAGRAPSPEALGVIKETKDRINELKAKLNDRFEQQRKIDDQAATHTAAVVSIRVPTPKE